jgi:hypothetical protein
MTPEDWSSLRGSCQVVELIHEILITIGFPGDVPPWHPWSLGAGRCWRIPRVCFLRSLSDPVQLASKASQRIERYPEVFGDEYVRENLWLVEAWSREFSVRRKSTASRVRDTTESGSRPM